jgi:hypothetical protein
MVGCCMVPGAHPAKPLDISVKELWDKPALDDPDTLPRPQDLHAVPASVMSLASLQVTRQLLSLLSGC